MHAMIMMMMNMFFRLNIILDLKIRITHKVLKLIHNLRVSIILINFGNIHLKFIRMSLQHKMWWFNRMTMNNTFLKDFVHFGNWIFTLRIRNLLVAFKHLFYFLFFFFCFFHFVYQWFLFYLFPRFLLLINIFW